MNLPFKKKVFYSLIPLMGLLLATEVGLRIIHFQHTADSPIAITNAFNNAREFYQRKLFQHKIKQMKIPAGTFHALYLLENDALLAEFMTRYEEIFQRLVVETAKINCKLIALYIPMDNFHGPRQKKIMAINRQFYSNICKKFKIDFLDTSDSFLQYPADVVTLLPNDGHLSRFGTKIVADKVGRFIESHYDEYKSGFHFSERPKIFGMIKPNSNRIRTETPGLPYRVIANSQGFRMNHDVTFPKKKQRILVLGDSFTFGLFLNNHDTFPEILNTKYPKKEFINAGSQGFTITNELSFFTEKLKYVEPDITILQVLDNDLPGLFYFNMNKFEKTGKKHKPSRLEQQFLDKLRQYNKTNGNTLGHSH